MKIKAYAVINKFKDSSFEGVIFSDKADAEDARRGCDSGSTLACEFTDLYGGRESLKMVEVEVEL